MKLPISWPPASCVSAPDSQVNNLRTAETVRWTVPPTRAVMPTFSTETWNDRDGTDPHRCAEDDADAAAQAAVARSLRNRAATVQSHLPRTPLGLSNSGIGLRRPETRD